MNFTIHCEDMAIGFFGVNILQPTKIDLSAAFVCDTARNLMGMNSTTKKWNKLIDDLHLGGAADYIEVTIPVAYSASNTFNWTDDSGSSGQDVDAYVSCRDGGSSNTICKVPVSMGFSAYTVTTPSSGNTGNTGGSPGGGGGAAGAGTYTITAEQFGSGVTRTLALNERLKLNISGETHYIKLTELTTTSITINVSSTPQIATLKVNESKVFDLDGDGTFDLEVRLAGISLVNGTAKNSDIYVKKYVAALTEPNENNETAGENTAAPIGNVGEIVSNIKESLGWGFCIVIVAIVLVIIWIIGYFAGWPMFKFHRFKSRVMIKPGSSIVVK